MSFGERAVQVTVWTKRVRLLERYFHDNLDHEGHLKWLKFILDRLVSASLKINQEKCEFNYSHVTYLGLRKPRLIRNFDISELR